ncbi:MAG TPA: hypothetical protein VLH85_10190 [Levilinea sp.]|nr:hypothetical protein [Levilinea sp.]
MEGPADTQVYFIAAHVIIFSVMALYVLSLWLRGRNLRQDEVALGELERQEAQRNARTSGSQ